MTDTSLHTLFGNLLSEGKTVQIAVTGLSMFPFLLPNDIIQVSPIKPENLKRGMVIVFQSDNIWVAHRLIKFDHKNGIAYTRGDGRATKDNPLSYEQIKGVAVKIVKSRWKLAKFSIGKYSGAIAFCSPVSGVVFRGVTYLISLLKS